LDLVYGTIALDRGNFSNRSIIHFNATRHGSISNFVSSSFFFNDIYTS